MSNFQNSPILVSYILADMWKNENLYFIFEKLFSGGMLFLLNNNAEIV